MSRKMKEALKQGFECTAGEGKPSRYGYKRATARKIGDTYHFAIDSRGSTSKETFKRLDDMIQRMKEFKDLVHWVYYDVEEPVATKQEIEVITLDIGDTSTSRRGRNR